MLKYYFFCLSFLFPWICLGQVTQSLFDIIEEQGSEPIVLQSNFKDLLSDVRSNKRNKGQISFKNIQGETLSLPLDIEMRGKYRRIKCDFPPLKLFLDKRAAKRQHLDDKYRSIRIVTHCYVDSLEVYDHLEREYLIYKMYQLISPDAYRIKKVTIEYRDSLNQTLDQHMALLIEDNDQLAFRLGAYECKNVFNMDEANVDIQNMLHVAGFQFLIANADWNTRQLKNIRLFKRGESYVLVPYDFDFAGIVHSKLALPNNNLGLYNIKDRCWVGPDMDTNDALLDKFEPLKDGFYQLVNDSKILTQASKIEMTELINSFYKLLESEPLANMAIYKKLE